jgi:hypothetical protein
MLKKRNLGEIISENEIFPLLVFRLVTHHEAFVQFLSDTELWDIKSWLLFSILSF